MSRFVCGRNGRGSRCKGGRCCGRSARGRRGLTVAVTAPAYHCAVRAQSAGVIPARAYRREGLASGRPGLTNILSTSQVSVTAPACRRAVRAQSATMMCADAYRRESLANRRARLTGAATPIIDIIREAFHCAVGAQRAGMPCAGAYGYEGISFTMRRPLSRVVSEVVLPPTCQRVFKGFSVGVGLRVYYSAASIMAADAYRLESVATRRPTLPILVTSPTLRNAVGAQSAGMVSAGFYGCKDTSRRR